MFFYWFDATCQISMILLSGFNSEYEDAILNAHEQLTSKINEQWNCQFSAHYPLGYKSSEVFLEWSLCCFLLGGI